MLAHILFVTKNLLQLLFEFLTTQPTGDDVSLRVEKERVGDGIEMVGFTGSILGVDDLRIGNGVFFDGGHGVGRLVSDGHTEDLQPFVLVFIVGSYEDWYFL